MQDTKKKTALQVFVKYVSLNVLGMIGLSCYILADTFFVSQALGADGLTALNLALPLFSFMSGLGLMLGIGGATRFSILKGEGDKKKCDNIFTQSVVFAMIIAVVYMIIGIGFSGKITMLLGADESVFGYTQTYIQTFLIFAPMFLLNNVLICFVRNDKNPNLAMIAMFVGSMSNVVLDYVFMFPLNMGMFGAALATGIAPVVSICILATHFIRKKNSFFITKVKLKIKHLFDMSSLGASSLITELSAGVAMILFNFIILNIKGNTGVAAYGVVANVALVIVAVFTGIAQGIQPIVSRSYGRGESENISKMYRYAIILAVGVAVAVYILSFLFTDNIVGIFNKDNNLELAEIAKKGILIYFSAFAFVGLNIITAAYFSSTDRPKQSFVIAMLRGFIVLIPMIIILPSLFDMTGVWLAFPVAEFMVAVVAIILRSKKPKIAIKP